MRRNPPIRITKNDRQEYAKLVRNTKAKIGRTAKNYGIDLSTEIKIPSLESFTNRSQFNEFKRQQESFTSRANTKYQFKKNEFGVVASKKEINEIKQNTKKAQRIADQLTKEAAKKPFISGGKEQGTVGQRMQQMGRPNTAGITRPTDFDFDKVRSKQQLEKKRENIKERANAQFFDKRMEQMKDNFLTLLEQSFNSDANKLVEKLKGVPADDFYEMYLMFDEFDFDLYYVTEFQGQSHDNQIKQLDSYIDRYYAGNLNMDMKGF